VAKVGIQTPGTYLAAGQKVKPVWGFEARNLGKVASADISMAPLVLLLGKNNTGKSYVATLAWAITNVSLLLSRDDARDRRHQELEQHISSAKALVS
jgi:hypothetical protein